MNVHPTIYLKIKTAIKLGKNSYYDALANAFLFSNNFGLLGDIVFTIFTLIWMTWPLAIAYKYNLISLWLSSIAVSTVFMIKG